MVKYAAVILLVVVGNALLAWAHYSYDDVVKIVRCGDQFSTDATRSHIDGTNSGNNDGLTCYENRNSPRPVVDNIRFSNTSRWMDICGYWERAVQCLRDLGEMSEEDAVARLENRTVIYFYGADVTEWGSFAASIYHFPNRVCHNYQVKSELAGFMNTDLSCLKRSDHVDFYGCYEALDCELDQNYGQWGTIKVIERFSAGALNCMRNVIDNTTCGANAKALLRFIAELQMPSLVDVAELNAIGVPVANLGSDKRCTVAVYANPNLLYCDAVRAEECAAIGETVFLSNSYIDIRGTNGEYSARYSRTHTVIRKIAITFKSADGTTNVTTYTAANSTLPRTFKNGKTTIGEGYDQLSISTDGNYRVIFIQSSIGAILVLRRWFNTYKFTLRMSSSLVKSSNGLLGTGCPPSQIRNRNGRHKVIPERFQRQSLQWQVFKNTPIPGGKWTLPKITKGTAFG